MLSDLLELLVKRGTGIYKHLSNGSLHDLVLPFRSASLTRARDRSPLPISAYRICGSHPTQ